MFSRSYADDPTLTYSSSKCWSNDTLPLFMGFIPLNDKKSIYPLLTESSTVAIVFYRGCFLPLVPKSNNDQALLLNRQGQKTKLAPWVQSLLYTLRILGPSNGKGLNLYSRGPGPRNSRFLGVRILRVVVFRLIAMWQYHAKTVP